VQAALTAPAQVNLPEPAPKAMMADAPAPVSAPVALLTAAAREVSSVVESFLPKKAPAPKAVVRRAAVMHRGNSKVVMQIASYGDPQQVMTGWNHLTERYPALRSYLPVRARFDSPKGTFWRLSVQGFASEREAIARCAELRGHGGHCFVRGAAGDAPMEMASR
jgi:hypothetical protein